MKRGDLDDLAAFATVARARSFTRAAAELGLSPSALSHAMRGLEERLGVALLARTTRSVAPKAAGERLLRSLDPALAEVADGLAALAEWRGAPSGALRLTTIFYAARTILAEKLPAFLVDHPDVSVEVIGDDRPVDIVSDGFDAGIRLGASVVQDMIAVRLEPDVRGAVVATPGYFQRHGRPLRPQDLEGHLCINYRLTNGGMLMWPFQRGGQEVRVRATGQLVVNDGMLCAAAVRAGVGVGLMGETDVADEVADGRLIRILDDWSPTVPGCHIYYPNRKISPALRALVDTLKWRG
jgi:DNA-binding transcriptional LysR family regulator